MLVRASSAHHRSENGAAARVQICNFPVVSGLRHEWEETKVLRCDPVDVINLYMSLVMRMSTALNK